MRALHSFLEVFVFGPKQLLEQPVEAPILLLGVLRLPNFVLQGPQGDQGRGDDLIVLEVRGVAELTSRVALLMGHHLIMLITLK